MSKPVFKGISQVYHDFPELQHESSTILAMAMAWFEFHEDYYFALLKQSNGIEVKVMYYKCSKKINQKV